jgi:hypothetical protein
MRAITRVARRGRGAPSAGTCRMVVLRVVDCADDRDHRPVFEDECALIAALSAALRVEDRAVERNSARFSH